MNWCDNNAITRAESFLRMNAETISAFQLAGRDTGDRPVELPLGEERALQSASEAFHALADTMPQLVWSTLPNGSHDYYNARWY